MLMRPASFGVWGKTKLDLCCERFNWLSLKLHNTIKVKQF